MWFPIEFIVHPWKENVSRKSNTSRTLREWFNGFATDFYPTIVCVKIGNLLFTLKQKCTWINCNSCRTRFQVWLPMLYRLSVSGDVSRAVQKNQFKENRGGTKLAWIDFPRLLWTNSILVLFFERIWLG